MADEQRIVGPPVRCSVEGCERPWYCKGVCSLHYYRAYRKTHGARLGAIKTAEARRAQAEGILHYGGKCACCGETEIKFLTIEHIDGRKDEKTRYTGKRAWQDLKRRGWPENITILCFNCNCAKGAFGKCPHQEVPAVLTPGKEVVPNG